MEGLGEIWQISLEITKKWDFSVDKKIQVEVDAYKSDKERDCRKGFDD